MGHAIKLEEVCTSWCWSIFWGRYEKRMSNYEHCHDETGFGNLNSVFGALTHLSYGDYLTQDIVDDYCTHSSLPGCRLTVSCTYLQYVVRPLQSSHKEDARGS